MSTKIEPSDPVIDTLLVCKNFLDCCSTPNAGSADLARLKKITSDESLYNNALIYSIVPKALNLAVSANNLKFVKYFFEHPHLNDFIWFTHKDAGYLLNAASCGHLEICKYFLSNYPHKFKPHIPPALEKAVINSHIDVVKYLSKSYQGFDEKTITYSSVLESLLSICCRQKNKKLLEFFIIDQKIKITPNMLKIISSFAPALEILKIRQEKQLICAKTPGIRPKDSTSAAVISKVSKI